MNRTGILLGFAGLLTAVALLGSTDSLAGPPKPGGACRGYTWSFKVQEGNIVRVGSDANVSNAYKGDTDCDTALPILCLKPLGLPSGDVQISTYSGWSGGDVALTSPVAGSRLVSRNAADSICAEQLGSGWRMGEHHDGKGSVGWGFAGRGRVQPGIRFWVAINDQPANPWNYLAARQ